MYARVSPIESDGGSFDEAAISTMREDMVPKVLGRPGNLGLIMVHDIGGGRGRSITLWEDEDAVRASDQAAAALREDATAQHDAKQTAASHAFEVTGFDLKPGVTA